MGSVSLSSIVTVSRISVIIGVVVTIVFIIVAIVCILGVILVNTVIVDRLFYAQLCPFRKDIAIHN